MRLQPIASFLLFCAGCPFPASFAGVGVFKSPPGQHRPEWGTRLSFPALFPPCLRGEFIASRKERITDPLGLPLQPCDSRYRVEVAVAAD